jgi:Zn-dependent M16 (insulinase) family peptidase
VNYVAKGACLFDMGYSFHGSVLVITRHLRNDWLWDQVRVQGGAYGAFSIFDRFSGVLSLLSYRDPNLLSTLDVFDRSAEFLRKRHLEREEVTKAIIGTIGDLDAPMLPDTKGYASMLRYLTGNTEQLRQQMRDEILRTKSKDFREFAEMLTAFKEKGIIKVLGSPSAIASASGDRGELLSVRNIL